VQTPATQRLLRQVSPCLLAKYKHAIDAQSRTAGAALRRPFLSVLAAALRTAVRSVRKSPYSTTVLDECAKYTPEYHTKKANIVTCIATAADRLVTEC